VSQEAVSLTTPGSPSVMDATVAAMSGPVHNPMKRWIQLIPLLLGASAFGYAPDPARTFGGAAPGAGAAHGLCCRWHPPRLPGRLGGGDQGGGELLVEGEEVFNAVPVAAERLGPVTAVNLAVQLLMRLE